MALHFITLCLILAAGLPAFPATKCEFEANTPPKLAVNLLLAGIDKSLLEMTELHRLAQTNTKEWSNPFQKHGRNLYSLSLFRGFDRVLPFIREKSAQTRRLLKAELAKLDANNAQVEVARENTKVILGAPRALTTLDIPSQSPGEYDKLIALSDPAFVDGRPIIVGTFSHRDPKIEHALVVFDPLNPDEMKRVELRQGSWGFFGRYKPVIFERGGSAYAFVPGKTFAFDLAQRKIVTFSQLKIPNFEYQHFYKSYLSRNEDGQKFITVVENDAKYAEGTLVLNIIDLNGGTPVKTVKLKRCAGGKFHDVNGRTFLTCISMPQQRHIRVYDIDNAVELPTFQIKGDLKGGMAREHAILFEENRDLQMVVQINEHAMKGEIYGVDKETGEFTYRYPKFSSAGTLGTVTLQGKSYILHDSSKFISLLDFAGRSISRAELRAKEKSSGFFDWQTESYYYQMSFRNEFQIFDLGWNMIASIRMQEEFEATPVFEHDNQWYVILKPKSSSAILYRLTNEENRN